MNVFLTKTVAHPRTSVTGLFALDARQLEQQGPTRIVALCVDKEERRRLLGDDVIAHIDALVDAAPEPTPEVVETLRRIFTTPQGQSPRNVLREA